MQTTHSLLCDRTRKTKRNKKGAKPAVEPPPRDSVAPPGLGNPTAWRAYDHLTKRGIFSRHFDTSWNSFERRVFTVWLNQSLLGRRRKLHAETSGISYSLRDTGLRRIPETETPLFQYLDLANQDDAEARARLTVLAARRSLKSEAGSSTDMPAPRSGVLAKTQNEVTKRGAPTPPLLPICLQDR